MSLYLTFLGTGTCQHTYKRPQSIVITADNKSILFDCGGGAYHSLAGINDNNIPKDIDHIVLSHFHTDHISGLPDFFWGEIYGREQKRSTPLTLIGPVGLKDFYNDRLLPFIDTFDIPFKVELIELQHHQSYTLNNTTIQAHSLDHTSDSMGFLIKSRKKSLAISGDTMNCKNLQLLLQQAEYAVMEWSFDEPVADVKHLATDDIKSLLQTDSLKNVYFLHLYTRDTITIPDEITRRKQYLKGIDANCIFPEDGQTILLD